MRRRGFVHQGVEIGHDVVHPIDEGARALRAAVAAMVERVHGKASRRQLLADPPVATAVLGRAMRQHDEGTRIAGGQPRLGVELEAALAGEAALVMLDRAHAAGSYRDFPDDYLHLVAAYVYLLRCADGTLYCGWSTDLERRVRQHEAGTASRYTR